MYIHVYNISNIYIVHVQVRYMHIHVHVIQVVPLQNIAKLNTVDREIFTLKIFRQLNFHRV